MVLSLASTKFLLIVTRCVKCKNKVVKRRRIKEISQLWVQIKRWTTWVMKINVFCIDRLFDSLFNFSPWNVHFKCQHSMRQWPLFSYSLQSSVIIVTDSSHDWQEIELQYSSFIIIFYIYIYLKKIVYIALVNISYEH